MSDIINKELYRLYKPLRNYLRPVSVENAFYVIWAYINNFQFDQEIPSDIEVGSNIVEKLNPIERGIYEWELSLLARECIANNQGNLLSSKENFNKWSYFSGAINKIKDFENNAWPIIGGTNIRNELRRISHRQFPWQLKPSSNDFLRYYKIYNSPRISEIIKSRIGMTIKQWYIIGTAIIGAILSNPKMNINPNIVISNITKKEFDVFLSFVSSDINQIKEIINRDVKFDDEYVYTFNPLEYYPLIKIGQYYYCPVITFLVWRITSGIYFDLIKDKADEKSFGASFGFAFQDYLEEISNKVLDKEKTIVIPEKKYLVKKDKKDSVDLILLQDNAVFFVEAKAKRLQSRSKSQLVSSQAIEKDLEILAKDIAQVYATIVDYKNNLYTNLEYNKDVDVFPVIVTMEDWFLFGEDSFHLKELVIKQLENRNIQKESVNDMPYGVCSARDFELLIQLLNNHKIIDIMKKWESSEKGGHNFGQFLLTNYRGENKGIDEYFKDDFEAIYSL